MKHIKKGHLNLAAIISFAFGIVSFILSTGIVSPFGFIALIFWATAFTLGIIYYIISYSNRSFIGRCSAIASVIFLFIPLVIAFAFILSLALPCIYTPGAITSEKLHLFERCIKIMKEHDEHLNLVWDTATGHIFVPINGGEEPCFSDDEIAETQNISKYLNKLNCYIVERKNNVVLFRIRTNYILPDSPGVIYSLNGQNPNEIDNELMNKYKPFIRILGNWYMSRKLINRNWRDLKYPIPKSIFDHSLQTKNVDLSRSGAKYRTLPFSMLKRT